jgi:transcription antitermination protein NusB
VADGRRAARRAAAFALYQQDLMGLTPEAALLRGERAGQAFAPYTRRLVLGANERGPQIDDLLARHLKAWTLGRLAPLERSILRLAVFEMLAVEDVPPAVAIDEAVELAKRFASLEAGALVNGVLAAVAAELAADPAAEVSAAGAAEVASAEPPVTS